MNLLTNQAVDGSSPTVLFNALHGKSNLYVSGNLGGGTLALEALAPDGVNYVPVQNVSITGDGMTVIESPAFAGRLTLTGATAADVSAWVEEEGNLTYQAAVRRS